MIITGRRKIAEHLDLSWGTVRKLHAREGLPLFKLGAQWAMDTEQLAQWLSRKSTPYHEVRHEQSQPA